MSVREGERDAQQTCTVVVVVAEADPLLLGLLGPPDFRRAFGCDQELSSHDSGTFVTFFTAIVVLDADPISSVATNLEVSSAATNLEVSSAATNLGDSVSSSVSISSV